MRAGPRVAPDYMQAGPWVWVGTWDMQSVEGLWTKNLPTISSGMGNLTYYMYIDQDESSGTKAWNGVPFLQ
jgi:hypothetical protein